MNVRSHSDIERLAIAEVRPERTLTVLSAANDPFTADQPARRDRAEWFAGLWTQHAFGHGVHLRRLHYTLLSREARMTDGGPYKNTDDCWRELCSAARDARYLRLVDSKAFVDHRTGLPALHAVAGREAEINSVEEDDATISLPDELPGLPWIGIKEPVVRQPYLVEIWVEKSTMNDILLPLAKRYQCNLVEGAGEQSVTRCDELVDRIIADGRPARIIYISDFDPAGASMPVAVARKVEHRIRYDERDLDIQVRPIALTLDQCNEHTLPATPIKESERRGNKFRERWGRDATELDALEALRPGLLRRMVIVELDRYFDHGLAGRVREKAVALQAHADLISADAAAEHAVEMAALNREYQAAKAAFEGSMVRIKVERQAIIKIVMDNLTAEAENLADEAEWPEPREGLDDDDPMFDSTRDYIVQCDRFKQHQGEPTEGKAAIKRARAAELGAARKAAAASKRGRESGQQAA